MHYSSLWSRGSWFWTCTTKGALDQKSWNRIYRNINSLDSVMEFRFQSLFCLLPWLLSIITKAKLRPKGIVGKQLMRLILFILNIAALEIDSSHDHWTKHFFTFHVCVFLQTLSKWLEYHLPRTPSGLSFDVQPFQPIRYSFKCSIIFFQGLVILIFYVILDRQVRLGKIPTCYTYSRLHAISTGINECFASLMWPGFRRRISQCSECNANEQNPLFNFDLLALDGGCKIPAI